MDFELSPTARDLRERLLEFMDERVYPAEAVYHEQMARVGRSRTTTPPVIEELKAEARARGLWNLFLPHKTEWTDGPVQPRLRAAGRDHGPQPASARRRCNCSAPDTGNMEILTMFGTPEQQERWLQPLLEGEIRSCFAMTEPAVASSDATNIAVPHRARRRRLRDQRPQVVDLGRGQPALQDRHPDGQDRPRRAHPPASSP